MTQVEVIPLLREGDRLSSREFLRRYQADPIVARAELIRAVVLINACWRFDGTPEAMSDQPAEPLHTLFCRYMLGTAGVRPNGPATVVISRNTVVEPAALMRVLPCYGGSAVVNADGYLSRAPELVAEVTGASASLEMGPKYEAYQAGGVQEYLVWRTADREFHLFTLKRGRYQPVQPTAEGVLKSVAFPGLWLDTAALLAGDLRKALETLQQGLAAPEHAAFVAKLAAAKAKRKK